MENKLHLSCHPWRLAGILLSVFLLCGSVGVISAHVDSHAVAGIDPPDNLVLAKIDLRTLADVDRVASSGVVVCDRLSGAEGQDYVLVLADATQRETLVQQGLALRVLDSDAGQATYYWAVVAPGRARPDWRAFGRVLLDEGAQVLLRVSPQEAERLTQAGIELRALSLAPKPLLTSGSADVFPSVTTPDPLIQTMINQVVSTTVSQHDRELAGELPVWVDGEWYTIPTRYTYSGVPIQKAGHYVGQRMADLGLDVEYHQWNAATNPNVIGELLGISHPENIFILCAHLDDVQGTPGADDNASGSVAVMMAADILTQYNWDCTLRFAFWTGEEQGLLGSDAYAARAYQQGENIVGVINLDMIAWNTTASSPDIDLYARTSIPASVELANLFDDVVDVYDLNLVPQILTSGGSASDNSSFWSRGYAAILGIEDNSDFNPYYHGSGDTPAHTDLAYFTDFVKASVGTLAHMGCLLGNVGALDGVVTDAGTGLPLDASVTATSNLASFTTTTNVAGYYTKTLPVGTYTISAQANLYGYYSTVVTDVAIVTSTVTHLDVELSPYPTYVVSGAVADVSTGAPLSAKITTIDCPGGACQPNTFVSVTSDPFTGYYSATLTSGVYTIRVQADGYRPVTRTIDVNRDQTQDVVLVPQGCVLLVDDDGGENIQALYQADLDALGLSYVTWNMASQGAPSLTVLEDYYHTLWLTGRRYSDTLVQADRQVLGQYLDGGGGLLLSGWGVGGDLNGVSFLADYLHASYGGDVFAGDLALEGVGVMAGHTLTITTTADYQASKLTPLGGAAAMYNLPAPYSQATAVGYRGDYGLAYLGFGLETVANVSERRATLDAILDWLGPCTVPPPVPGFTSSSPDVIGTATIFTNTSTGAEPITYTWDFGDESQAILQPTEPLTLTHVYGGVGEYTVWLTATNAGGSVAVSGTVEITGRAPSAGFVSSSPVELGEVMVFTNTSEAGEPEATAYVWAFGDGVTSTLEHPTHTYTIVDTHTLLLTSTTYVVWLRASNPAGEDVVSGTVQVLIPHPPTMYSVYLPVILKN